MRGAHGTFDRLDVPLEVGVKGMGMGYGLRGMGTGTRGGIGGGGGGRGVIGMGGGMALERTEAGVVQGEIEAELEEAGVRLVEVRDVDRLFGRGE